VVLWLAGEFLDVFPKGTLLISARNTHIAVGLLLGVLLVTRLRWRRNGGRRLPTLPSGAMGVAAKSGHVLLYALIAAMVLSGIALVWIRGDNLSNLFTVPAFDPGNKALRHDAKELHGFIANTLLILGGLHGVVALWHQLVLKDGLLRRMWPSPKQAPGA
jgi:cytochrome b561